MRWLLPFLAAGLQDDQPRCLQEPGRPNFFLLFPLTGNHFGHLHYATLETILFQHPSANVVILAFDLPELFAAYRNEGGDMFTQDLAS